jgi:hypothetical protein
MVRPSKRLKGTDGMRAGYFKLTRHEVEGSGQDGLHALYAFVLLRIVLLGALVVLATVPGAWLPEAARLLARL